MRPYSGSGRRRQLRLVDERDRLQGLLVRLRAVATNREDYEPHDITDDEAALQADAIEEQNPVLIAGSPLRDPGVRGRYRHEPFDRKPSAARFSSISPWSWAITVSRTSSPGTRPAPMLTAASMGKEIAFSVEYVPSWDTPQEIAGITMVLVVE